MTGDPPIHRWCVIAYAWWSIESRSLGRERQSGGRFHPRLNTSPNTIANKYREGKVESTLERELNVPEIVADQAIGTSLQLEMCSRGWVAGAFRTSGVLVYSVSGSTDLRSSADTCRRSEYATVNLSPR